MSLRVLRTTAEAALWAQQLRASRQTLALVPTMGFLHEGHVSLMQEGRRRAQVVATTLFVNPTQFGPTEDLAQYPRDFDGDLSKCAAAGVTAVFAPSNEEMYPKGYQTNVEVNQASQGLCGAKRPGHFRGVATVVTKLLCLFRPEVALFGEKDFQQLQVIRALNRDLNLGVEILGMPTVRENDGLAKSSRNAYLSEEERVRALSLYQGLMRARQLVQAGTRQVEEIKAAVRELLEEASVKEDYIEIVEEASLAPLTEVTPGRPARILLAGFVGRTRLIDNAAL